MVWTPIDERTADNPRIGRGTYNAQLKGNLEDLKARLEALETAAAGAPLTIRAVGDSSATTSALGVLGFWKLEVLARGVIIGGTVLPSYTDVEATMDGTRINNTRPVRAEAGDTQSWDFYARSIIECTNVLDAATASVDGPGGSIADGGLFAVIETELWATYDGPAA